MAILFTNNASSLLAVSIGPADTSIQLASTTAFPIPTGGNVFYIALEDNLGAIEYVRCSGNNGTNTLTVDTGGRGIDGTTAQSFTANTTRVELRLIKTVVDALLQKSGGVMTGSLDMDGNNLVDAVLTGGLTSIQAGEIVNVPLRGATGISTNEITVPVNGTSRAKAGGADILVVGDDLIPHLDTAGIISFTSATTGVKVPASAYLRVEGSTAAHYFEVVHDDTDVNFNFGTATELNVPLLLNVSAGGVRVQDLDVIGPQLIDFAVKKQSVTATTTTAIDYTLGSYVTLTMATSISAFSITEPPATHVGTLRLKIVQGTGGQTITWPGSVLWPENVAPTLSTGAGAVDFVDLWTDNNGATWYGAYNTNWS